MKATTRKAFESYCSDEVRALITPVKKQSGCGSWEDFTEFLDNVSASPCGAAAGFGGFIYYTETVGFWRANRKKITALIGSEAEEFGASSSMEMVRDIRALEDFDDTEIARALYGRFDEDLTQVYNVFAWYALETVAYSWMRFKEDNE